MKTGSRTEANFFAEMAQSFNIFLHNHEVSFVPHGRNKKWEEGEKVMKELMK